MITVRFIEYWDDYRQTEKKEHFIDLGKLADWIFGQMQVDYTKEDNRYALYFPKCEAAGRVERISVTPSYWGPTLWIKLIEDDCRGILFSDGTFTAGQKHCIGTVRRWLAECEERRKHPVFDFAKDEPKADAAPFSTIIPIDTVKKVAYAIHRLGGGGAKDTYAEGYDAAIDMALDILLKETKMTIDEIINYGETQEG